MTGETSQAAPQPRARAIAAAYAALLLCFLITNFTNTLILDIARARFGIDPAWLLVADPAAAAQRARYLLIAAKDTLFFAGFLTLTLLIWRSFPPLWPLLRRSGPWVDLAIALVIASIFLFQILPFAAGHSLAMNSADPFAQEQGFYHRRILMPLLANWLHLGGVSYAIFCWGLLLFSATLTNLYLQGKGLALSRLELASLLTVGVFGGALGHPGYVELLVYLLVLLAMIDFDRTGRSGIVQIVLFGLGLLTHEIAASLAFGVLALCRFDRRFLIHYIALVAIYGFVWLAGFGFDPGAVSTAQRAGTVGDAMWFLTHPWLGPLAAFFAFKLTLLAAAVAVWRFVRGRDYRNAALIMLAFAGGMALCLLGTDYTRFATFATFALLVALPVVLPGLSARQRTGFAIANLLIPTLAVSTQKVVAYQGLYRLVFAPLLDMPR